MRYFQHSYEISIECKVSEYLDLHIPGRDMDSGCSRVAVTGGARTQRGDLAWQPSDSESAYGSGNDRRSASRGRIHTVACATGLCAT